MKLSLMPPHDGQKKILDNLMRFNVIICGRRFGKTDMFAKVGKNKLYVPLIFPCLKGKRIGLFCPEYKDIAETWKGIKETFAPFIIHTDNTKYILRFINGGVLECWSLQNISRKDSGKSRKYHRVIYEETQKIDEPTIEHNWKEAVRPTLVDYKGDAFFIGTGSGQGTWWHKLCQRGVVNGNINEPDLPPSEKVYKNWVTFKMPTITNPFIDPEEVEDARNESDELTWLQEYWAFFPNFTGKPWCYALEKKSIQEKVFKTGYDKINWSQPLYLGIDVNKQPMSCVIMQKIPFPLQSMRNAKMKWYQGIVFRQEIITDLNQKRGVYDLVVKIQQLVYKHTGQKIGRWYKMQGDDFVLDEHGNRILTGDYRHRFRFRITGDASANTGSVYQHTPFSIYETIATELRLNIDNHFTIPKKNPYHSDSSVQVNTLFQLHPLFIIDEKGCPNLKKDCLNVRAGQNRTIDKESAKKHESHLLDCFRYVCWQNLPH